MTVAIRRSDDLQRAYSDLAMAHQELLGVDEMGRALRKLFGEAGIELSADGEGIGTLCVAVSRPHS